MRENAHTKGELYVLSGRLTILSADDHRLEATCRKSGHQYTGIHDGSRGACSFPAEGRYAHMIALAGVLAARFGGVGVSG
jgi:hypothetical protein